MATQAAVRQRRVRYWSRPFINIILGPSLSVLFWGLGIWIIVVVLIPGNRTSSDDPAAPFGIVAVLMLAGFWFIMPAFWPALMLTTHTLRRPRVLRRAQITPLDQVTGIGLVYLRHVGDPAPQGWFLYLWTTGDIPCDLGIFYSPISWLHPVRKVRRKFLAVEPSAPERVRPWVDNYRFGFRFNPVTQTDPDKIAATYAGRVAREIYGRVLAYQGPSGLLVLRQDQKHVPVPAVYDSVMQSAYWSPDGELGHAAAKPLPHRSASPAHPPPRPHRPGLKLRLQYLLRLAGRRFKRHGGDAGDILG